MVVDSQSDPVPEIYIRELLDLPSNEFKTSKISPKQKMEVIQELGLEALTSVLKECFLQAGKNYDAAQEAELAMNVLTRALEREPKPVKIESLSADEQSAVKLMLQFFAEDAALDQEEMQKRRDLRKHYYSSEFITKTFEHADLDEASSQKHIEEVRSIEMGMHVITFQSYGSGNFRHCYHLQKGKKGWEITHIDSECHACQGAGRWFSEICDRCNGRGWC